MRHDNNKDLKWEASFEENKEFEINNVKEYYTVRIIKATYPAGNKMIVYLNAKDGKEIALSEMEAGNL